MSGVTKDQIKQLEAMERHHQWLLRQVREEFNGLRDKYEDYQRARRELQERIDRVNDFLAQYNDLRELAGYGRHALIKMKV